MPRVATPPTKVELYAQNNGALIVRVPDPNGRDGWTGVKTGTAAIPKARKFFAAYLRKNKIVGIDADTDPVNSSVGFLDVNSPRSPAYLIKLAHKSNGANGSVPADVQKHRDHSKSYYHRKKAERATAGGLAKGNKLQEAKDLVQIIAGAWAAASTALRRLETILGDDA